MPTYEFKCEKCSHEFEHDQKMSDPNPPCPRLVHGTKIVLTCGGPTKKLISRTSFVLEGGGWASDGYGSGKH